jgi:hypothetical protein
MEKAPAWEPSLSGCRFRQRFARSFALYGLRAFFRRTRKVASQTNPTISDILGGTLNEPWSCLADTHIAASSWSIPMATQAEARSLSEFEREAEHTRADLIHTVNELQNRASPQAIKEEVKAYVRDSGQDFVRNLERRARENPLPTVAVAAGLAYPVWRLLVNIPVPVLLVGAGLALTRTGSMPSAGSYRTGGFGGYVPDTMKRTMQDASSTISDTWAGMKDRLADVKDRTAGMASDAKTAMTASMNDAAERAASAAGDTVNSARNVASDTLSATQQKLSETYQSGVDTMVRTRDQLTETFRQSSGTLAETIESYPFVWGAVGLLVGAAIASALPVTQAENRFFGDASNQLKNRAGDLANRGMQVATDAAQDVYHDAVSRAKEQGLGSNVVRETIKNAEGKVRSVVAQASDALEKEHAASAPSSTSPVNRNMGD